MLDSRSFSALAENGVLILGVLCPLVGIEEGMGEGVPGSVNGCILKCEDAPQRRDV
jgi:hypothetical protein